jgi:hypothetical protein
MYRAPNTFTPGESMQRQRVSSKVWFASSILFVAAACSSSSTPKSTPGTGGQGGTSAGTAGHAGTSGGGTSGTAGHAGTSGGTAGTVGTGGGGAGGQSICSGVKPTDPLISDFSTGTNSAFGSLGVDPVVGNTYVSGTSLTEDFSNSTWHLTGQAFGRQTFFGISWTCPAAPSGGCTLDISKYTGISFTIKGNVGPSGMINFTLGRKENDRPAENAMCGTCAGADETACHGPRLAVTVPPASGAAATVSLTWAQFVGGAPQASIDPTSPLTGMLWYFDNQAADAGVLDGGTAGTDAAVGDAGPTGPSYPIDVIIDDLKFTTAATDGGTGG